jgi:acyl-CoA thioesterase-1
MRAPWFQVLLSFFALGTMAARAAESPRTIVFFGDSLTAGYGLADPAAESYPARIQAKISAAGLGWRVVNAGLSGETTAGGLRRVDWVLRQPVDLFVLALGANDGLRGLDPALTRKNLEDIIGRVRARYPQAKIALGGMQMPPSMGADYARAFETMFAEVAQKQGAALIPFLLEGVGGIDRLNQPDQIHPNAEGHRLVAETVWKVLRPLL